MTNNVKNYFKQGGSGADNDFVLGGDVDVKAGSIIKSNSNPSKSFSFDAISLFYNHLESTVVVKQASDLIDIDSTKNYIIDGVVDMGGQSIIVPPGGASISGSDSARDISILYSEADNYTMFLSPEGSYSGNVVLQGCTLDVAGSNSQIFNLDNDNNGSALDIVGVNFGRFANDGLTSLGSLSNYRQLLNSNVGYIQIQDGLTFNGVWTGIRISIAIALSLPAITLFKKGDDFTVDNISSDINFLSVESASVLFDFNESNIVSKAGFSLSNVRVGATNALPNFLSSSSYARFRNCMGVKNTYVGGRWTITSEDTTNIATSLTPVKLAGATTYSELQWFTQTTDNAFVYDGEQNINVEVKGVLSISGTSNNQINLFARQWDDSASTYINSPKVQATMNSGASGSRAEGIPLLGYFNIDNNDRIEIWVENNGDNKDVVAKNGGLVSVTERSS